MASFFTLILDTLGPANPTVSINGGAGFYTGEDGLVTLTISTDDPITTGYQMLIWGDVDPAYDVNIQASEGTSTYSSFVTSKQIKLSSGEGSKYVYLKIRDDVHNVSAQVSDEIIVDTTKPSVTITGPDFSKISKISPKNVSAFSLKSDLGDFVEYKVKVVGSSGAAHDTGTVIGTSNGSTNMTGTGTWTIADSINCTINGADLETASAGDGNKLIKVFIKDQAGNWSA